METIKQPLDIGLNVAVQHIAARYCPTGFDVSESAPNSFNELITHIETTGRICVYSGGSDQTIFADAETNYAFRAWHDAIHFNNRFEFTTLGEFETWRAHCRDLFKLFGENKKTHKWADLLYAEIVGQAEYLARHGSFPANQYAFTVDYINNGPKFALERNY